MIRNRNNTKEDTIKSEMNKTLFFHIHLPETIYLSCMYSISQVRYRQASFTNLHLFFQTRTQYFSFVSPSFLLPKTPLRYFHSFSLPSLCSSLHPMCCLTEYAPSGTQAYRDKVIEQIPELLETENDLLKIIWKLTSKRKYYIFRGNTPEDTDKYKEFHKRQSMYIKITSINMVL